MIFTQWLVIHNLEKKIPVKGTEGKKLLGIVDKWWQELEPPPIKIQKYGDEGEKNLLDALGRNLPNSFLALHSFMTRKVTTQPILAKNAIYGKTVQIFAIPHNLLLT